MTTTHLTETRFDSLGLVDEIIRSLHEANYEVCTPIQAATLPISIKGEDVAGQAQTGTGKTAAFLIAVFQLLLTKPAADHRKINQPRALILAPTRELAIQIHKDAELLGKHTGLKLALAYGGTGYDQQKQQIQSGVDILIGTPGRLIDYFKQKVFNLRACDIVVLDEADRMFDLGFITDIRFLMRRMPEIPKRMGLLFSATLSFRVMELAYEHMNNPSPIKIEAKSITAEKVNEYAYMVANDEKIPLLIGLLQLLKPHRSIIFINTKRVGNEVWGFLEGNGIKSAVLSGDVPQQKRQQLLEQFQRGELPILVATDVAARGLHIPAVSHIFNYDLPDEASDYVHRIGRTARAGASGEAISFACETYVFSLPEIEDYIEHKIPIQPVTNALLADIDPKSRVYPPQRKPHSKPTHQRRKPNRNTHR